MFSHRRIEKNAFTIKDKIVINYVAIICLFYHNETLVVRQSELKHALVLKSIDQIDKP